MELKFKFTSFCKTVLIFKAFHPFRSNIESISLLWPWVVHLSQLLFSAFPLSKMDFYVPDTWITYSIERLKGRQVGWKNMTERLHKKRKRTVGRGCGDTKRLRLHGLGVKIHLKKFEEKDFVGCPRKMCSVSWEGIGRGSCCDDGLDKLEVALNKILLGK